MDLQPLQLYCRISSRFLNIFDNRMDASSMAVHTA
jgi:hypothetical protein